MNDEFQLPPKCGPVLSLKALKSGICLRVQTHVFLEVSPAAQQRAGDTSGVFLAAGGSLSSSYDTKIPKLTLGDASLFRLFHRTP